MKKTLMITGASGFIGSNFIKKYESEYNIIPVCLIEKSPEELDFTGVDSILHLAALVHQMKGAPEERYFEINTELTRRLAVKAKEAG
ncbi:MAG: UDP-N-acetylenolpyruvoylglucosamine reductase, partial [Fusobacteriaceae bacterium]